MIIEARFDKRTILEAYVTRSIWPTGWPGGPRHRGGGFWFGRELDQLSEQDIALLVGMIQALGARSAPAPEAALQRAIGCSPDVRHWPDQSAPNASARRWVWCVRQPVAQPVSRLPALVRDQLQRDYSTEALRGAGLTVLTTLSPSAQNAAETAVAGQLKTLEQKGRPPLQAALVLTDTTQGEILALVGARDPGDHGFNRALDARRQVGSLLKPFVYLLALAQPGRFALATRVDDAPITLRLPGNRSWTPENADNRSHGRVTLQEALVRSYNQARCGSAWISAWSGWRACLMWWRRSMLRCILASCWARWTCSLQTTQAYQFIAPGGQPEYARCAVCSIIRGYRCSHDAASSPQRMRHHVARLVSIALRKRCAKHCARSGCSALPGCRRSARLAPATTAVIAGFAGYTGSAPGRGLIGND